MTRHRLPRAGTRLVLASVAAVALLGAGCGQSGGPEMARLSGKVTYKGQPLTKGIVSFVPTDPARPGASGPITSNGTFTLQTREPGDGVEVGEYKVAVSDIDPDAYNTELPGQAPQVPKSAIPEKYAKPDTSGLTYKVVSGSNSYDIDLQD